ncbi:MAG: hypothetical protein KF723_06215 [Rhizobiaceae bacterium]|nr:hypothetical protein [Rhizobiaceae bacterium]
MAAGGSWTIAVEGERVTVTDSAGQTAALLLAELTAVAIETKDTGPFAADLWWLMFGPGLALAVAFPQDADGANAVVDRLMALPGFDHEAMIGAMGSTDNAFFPLWKRSGDG